MLATRVVVRRIGRIGEDRMEHHRSIALIRSHWVRRLLIVVFCLTLAPIALLCEALAVFTDWVMDQIGNDIIRAWSGPKT